MWTSNQYEMTRFLGHIGSLLVSFFCLLVKLYFKSIKKDDIAKFIENIAFLFKMIDFIVFVPWTVLSYKFRSHGTEQNSFFILMPVSNRSRINLEANPTIYHSSTDVMAREVVMNLDLSNS